MYDIKQLHKLNKLNETTPNAMAKFQALNDAVFAEGALSEKIKELIAVGVALSRQCIYCIKIHKKNAKNAGATEQELAEAMFVAAAIGAGAVVTHDTHIID